MDLQQLAVESRSLRALARRLVRDAADADDVVQEACLLALRNPPPRDAPLRRWLAGVVRNLSRHRRRDDARRLARERRAARPERVGPVDEAVERAEVHRALLDELLALEEPYRSTLLLRFLEGLTHAEVAARLGVPAGTVSARLHRGLRLLRARLDRRFGGPLAWCAAFLALGERPSPVAWGALAVSTKKTVSLVVVCLVALVALVALVGVEIANRPSGETARGGHGSASVATAPAAGTPAPAPTGAEPAAVDRDRDLFGVVVDTAGAAVAGARVESFWYPWRRGRMDLPDRHWIERRGPTATTGSDGRFALRLHRGQQVDLRTTADGFQVSELSCLQAGERVRIVLGAGVRVVFEIVTPEGEPVPGADVSLARNEAETAARNYPERRGTSGPDGLCAFEGLPPSAWGYLTITSATTVGTWQRVRFPAQGEARIRVEARPGRTLFGIVRDAASGEAIPGARVGLGWNLRRAVVTDAVGRYELTGWGQAGVRALGVAADGYARRTATVGAEDRIDFALESAGTARGRILACDGAPLAGALLCVRGRDAGGGFATYTEGTSGPDGTFSLPGVARGIVNTLTVMRRITDASRWTS